MCQHGSFGAACTTTCELKIGDVMRTDYAVVDLQDMPWYTLSLLKQFVILDEAVIIAANKTNSLKIWQYFVQLLVLESFEQRLIVKACNRRCGEEYATSFVRSVLRNVMRQK